MCTNVDESQKHHAKWKQLDTMLFKKPDTHKYWMIPFIWNSVKHKTVETESRSVVAWGWKEKLGVTANEHDGAFKGWCNYSRIGLQ